MTTDTLTRSSGLIPFVADQDDPRRTLDENALVAASRNAFPIVATRVARRDRAGLAAGAAGAMLLGGLTLWSMSGSTPRVSPPNPQPTVSRAALPLAVQHPAIAPPTPAQQAAIAQATQPATASAPSPVVAPNPVMVWDTSGAPDVTASASPVPPPAAPARVTAPQPLSDNESFATRMGDSGTDVASATRIVDPANTVTQGTLIPAVLETAINGDLPGYARAVVSQDVRSFDGSRVLVPRSSRLIGQYHSGLAAGQTRAYVMWTRLIRPDGVTVQLASPAVEFSGESGLTGEVNSHFMARFGATALLSIVGGLGAIATGGTSLVLSGGSSAASVAAQRDSQIPPTIRVAVGQPIRVFTARDLDFSTVSGSVQP